MKFGCEVNQEVGGSSNGRSSANEDTSQLLF